MKSSGQVGSTERMPPLGEAVPSIVLRFSFLPSLFCFTCPVSARILASIFRCILLRVCSTYVNSQYTGDPGSPLSQYIITGGACWTKAQPYYCSRYYVQGNDVLSASWLVILPLLPLPLTSPSPPATAALSKLFFSHMGYSMENGGNCAKVVFNRMVEHFGVAFFLPEFRRTKLLKTHRAGVGV